MQFPTHIVLRGTQYERTELSNGLVYAPHQMKTPYVFIPGYHTHDFAAWLVRGIYRVRVSQAHKPAEFQRGATHAHVAIDHMVKGSHADTETISFAKAFWSEMTHTPR
jgi:hypothetical protein